MKQFICPNCGGKVRWDPNSTLKCVYCSSEFDLSDNLNSEEVELKESVCNSCGSELITTEDQITIQCSYCRSDNVEVKNISEDFQPNRIIPFRVDKNAAMEIFRSKMRKQWLVSNKLKRELSVDLIKGIYLPYWTYDFDISAKISFVGVNKSSDGKSKVRYRAYREFDAYVDDVPVYSSTRIDSRFAESIEPFDNSKLEQFDPQYLIGFAATRFTKDSQQCLDSAKERVIKTIDNIAKNEGKRYSEYHNFQRNIKSNILDTSYTLMPCWMVASIYGDNVYYSGINGQNGKFVTDLPTSKSKIISIFLSVFLLSLLVLFNSEYNTSVESILILNVFAVVLTFILRYTIKYRKSKDKGNKNNDLEQIDTEY